MDHRKSNCERQSRPSSEELIFPAIVINIDPSGELLLQKKHDDQSIRLYQVSLISLRCTSAYFNALLDPDKFSEGAAIRTKLAELRKLHAHVTSAPVFDLPRVTVLDIGQVPQGKLSEAAFKQFLSILHTPKSSSPAPRTHFIYTLALLAD